MKVEFFAWASRCREQLKDVARRFLPKPQKNQASDVVQCFFMDVLGMRTSALVQVADRSAWSRGAVKRKAQHYRNDDERRTRRDRDAARLKTSSSPGKQRAANEHSLDWLLLTQVQPLMRDWRRRFCDLIFAEPRVWKLSSEELGERLGISPVTARQHRRRFRRWLRDGARLWECAEALGWRPDSVHFQVLRARYFGKRPLKTLAKQLGCHWHVVRDRLREIQAQLPRDLACLL